MARMLASSVGTVCVVFLMFAVYMEAATTKPHIIIILADDLGWNDLSFHGSDQIPTPNIDALAYNGVILNQHYVLPICTPSRSALMTGMYPIHTGMQGIPIGASEARAMPKGKILPEYLKDLGYSTKAVGKWHLGFYREDFLPRNRGFDSHMGYWNGFVSYYDYVIQQDGRNNRDFNGFDLRRNETVAYDAIGTYATDLFTNEAIKVIREQDKNKPLFLYLSHLAVHSGNKGKLLEAPEEWVNRFKYITDPNRRTLAAMVAKMDESVGRVVQELEKNNMLQNSIIIFMSDNGAPTIGIYPNWGSNYPFRGIKETLWEGGVRGAALIWSPLIKKTPRVSSQLIHVSDWLPTLYAAAGGSPYNLPKIDGVNQWPTISQNLPSERRELLLNIDEVQQSAAIRIDSEKYHWKLVVGTIQNGTYDDYFGEGTNARGENNPPYDTKRVLASRVQKTLEKLSQRHLTPFPTSAQTMSQLRNQATVKCAYTVFNPKRCNPIEGPDQICLYDLKNDPCEFNNLTPFYPNVARYLFKQLVEHRQSVVPQLNRPTEIERANPAFFNNTWSVWYDKNGVPLVTLDPSLVTRTRVDFAEDNEAFRQ